MAVTRQTNYKPEQPNGKLADRRNGHGKNGHGNGIAGMGDLSGYSKEEIDAAKARYVVRSENRKLSVFVS